MVCKFVPFPDNSGGRQRSLAIARRLASRFDLALCAFDDGEADIAGLEAMGVEVHAVPWRSSPAALVAGVARARTVSAGRFCHPRLLAAVRQAAGTGPLDLLFVGYPQLAPLAAGVGARLRVLDFQNIESALVASYAGTRSAVLAGAMRVEAAALRRLERRALGEFHLATVVSEVDRLRLPGPASDVLVCPNGIEPAAVLPPASGPVAIFVATMGWAPNVDAALWLGRSVWPLVLRRLPDARLLIVGRDPHRDVLALAGPSIEVTGTVVDVRPYLAAARVALAPLRAGGGTRLKVLEALLAGRPTVATTIGAEGLDDLVDHGVVIADSEEDQAEAIIALLADGDRAETLGRAGHEAVTARYTWDRTLAALLDRARRD